MEVIRRANTGDYTSAQVPASLVCDLYPDPLDQHACTVTYLVCTMHSTGSLPWGGYNSTTPPPPPACSIKALELLRTGDRRQRIPQLE